MLDKTTKNIFSLCFLFLGTMVVGCKGHKDVPQPPKIIPVAAAPTPAPVEEKPKQVYVYGGDKYRDIFTPAGVSTNYQAEASFDPQKASIKGIVFSLRYKSAVLNVTGSGSYFVKDGQIFDIMGKAVKGISAKVMADRVILKNESDNVFEIKLKNDEEEAKTL